MTPTVTTIIPAHNAAMWLRRAVGSLLRGGGGHGIDAHEIIIVDDGSTDATRDLAEELALGDERVWVIEQAHKGVSAARNTGIELARGEWLHFLDADDWMLEGGLERLIAHASRSHHAGACSGTFLFEEDESSYGCRAAHAESLACERGEVGIAELLGRNCLRIGATVIRRSAVGDFRFDPSLSCAEDWDMWLRLAERGHRWSLVRGEVAAYQLRRGGASHCFATMAGSIRSVLSNAFERCRRNCTDVIPMSELRRDRLDGSLRRAVLQQATASALDDAARGCDGAFTVLVSNWAGERAGVSASELAEAAYWMMPFADGKAPTAWREADPMVLARYVRAAGTLWDRLASEGFVAPGVVEAAREELAALCVGADDIAIRLAASCDPRREVTLIGVGGNAPRVARALRARGVHFDARDESRGTLRAEEAGAAAFVEVGGVEVEIVDPNSPYNPAALHLVTVADDAGIVARLPPGLEVLRWSEARRELQANETRRMSGLWLRPDADRLGVAA